jgi:hypothetical protein
VVFIRVRYCLTRLLSIAFGFENLAFGQPAIRSTGFWALLTEGHAGQLFLETLPLFRIAGTRQAVSQLEEAFPFLLPGFDTGLDEIIVDTRQRNRSGV